MLEEQEHSRLLELVRHMLVEQEHSKLLELVRHMLVEQEHSKHFHCYSCCSLILNCSSFS